jgi:endo-1,4-beta-xylanase
LYAEDIWDLENEIEQEGAYIPVVACVVVENDKMLKVAIDETVQPGLGTNMAKNADNWYNIIGEDYIWHAFNFAKKYAPANIALFYNDYNEQFKTATLESFVKTLVDKDGNYLIDGIGLQAHLYTEDSLTEYFKMVDRLAELGLKIEITELDVGLGRWQHIQKANDDTLATQGRFYYNLVEGILQRKDAGTLNIDSLTVWGVTDGRSWRKEYSPLLFDASFGKKPAFYGAAQLKDFAGFLSK